jgi:GNAT superfamily N-acetyltransferase
MYITDVIQRDSKIYGGRPHIELQNIGVDPDYRQQGIAKELNRLAITYAKEVGVKGRITQAIIATQEKLNPLIQYLIGWRHVDRDKAKEMKQHVKSGIKTGFEKFVGKMYLPKSKRKKLAHRQPISTEEEY